MAEGKQVKIDIQEIKNAGALMLSSWQKTSVTDRAADCLSSCYEKSRADRDGLWAEGSVCGVPAGLMARRFAPEWYRGEKFPLHTLPHADDYGFAEFKPVYGKIA